MSPSLFLRFPECDSACWLALNATQIRKATVKRIWATVQERRVVTGVFEYRAFRQRTRGIIPPPPPPPASDSSATTADHHIAATLLPIRAWPSSSVHRYYKEWVLLGGQGSTSGIWIGKALAFFGQWLVWWKFSHGEWVREHFQLTHQTRVIPRRVCNISVNSAILDLGISSTDLDIVFHGILILLDVFLRCRPLVSKRTVSESYRSLQTSTMERRQPGPKWIFPLATKTRRCR